MKKHKVIKRQVNAVVMPILTCNHPDRDCPKLRCGYPLPCPWHTAVIDTTINPPTVTIPITSQAIRQREKLGEIAECLSKKA